MIFQNGCTIILVLIEIRSKSERVLSIRRKEMKSRKELKTESKEALKRNYWKSVFVCAIYALFISGAGTLTARLNDFDSEFFGIAIESIPIVVLLVLVLVVILFALLVLFSFALITNPFIVGVSRFKLKAIEDKGNISDMGYGFDVNYKRNVGTILLMEIYTFLWSLLFVVPGIVKMYEYSMIPYILADNPDIDRKEAFSISKEMMKGNKWRAFILDLSFILWDFLGTITGGIVTLFYVGPYRELTKASLYKAIKEGE